jgi:hypothetical protein
MANDATPGSFDFTSLLSSRGAAQNDRCKWHRWTLEIEQDAHRGLSAVRGIQPAGAHSDEAKSYFTGEDKIIIAQQRSGPAGTYIKGVV